MGFRESIHKPTCAQIRIIYIRYGLLSFLVNESGPTGTAEHFRQLLHIPPWLNYGRIRVPLTKVDPQV